jgi:hypothetical protein
MDQSGIMINGEKSVLREKISAAICLDHKYHITPPGSEPASLV